MGSNFSLCLRAEAVCTPNYTVSLTPLNVPKINNTSVEADKLELGSR